MLTREKYRTDILNPNVVPHFDNIPPRNRPVYMDDNVRRYRGKAVLEFLHQDAIETLPWPVCSPDLKPIEHLWDIIGRTIH